MKSISLFYVSTVVSVFLFAFCPDNLLAQTCSGAWSQQRPLAQQCIVGQWIGWQNVGEPTGCPQNPTYIGTQSNTFTFTNPVSGFSIDFQGFDGISFCARLAIYINGQFYPLTTSNLIELPAGTTCFTGSFSYISLTGDGYITSSATGGPASIGKGRLVFTNVDASSITISTNDGNGTVFSNPYDCMDILPLYLTTFECKSSFPCEATLFWRTGTESNIRNIEIQGSDDGVRFKKIAELPPKGSNSNYTVETSNEAAGYFRLKIKDNDGYYEFSKIIHAKSNCNKSTYSITPNPSTGIINITGLSGNEKILIYDMAGRNVLSFAEPFTNTYNITKLSGGLYVVAILQDKICKAQLKLVKASFN